MIFEKKSVIIHSVYISYRTEDNRGVYKNVQEHTAAQSESLQQSGTDQYVSPAAPLPFTARAFYHTQNIHLDTSFQLNIL